VTDENSEIARRLVEESDGIDSDVVSSFPRNRKATSLDHLMSLMQGAGYGVPFSEPAQNFGRFLGEKITGKEAGPTFVEKSPIVGNIGRGAGMIPQFMAGGMALAGSKLPWLASKGIMPAMTRGAVTNVGVQEFHDPSISPTKIGFDAVMGAIGETLPTAAKSGAKKLWGTVLKRPAGEVSEEILKGARSVEEKIVDRRYMPATLKGLVKKAKKSGEKVIPERNAIIEGITQKPSSSTIVGPIKEEIASLKPGFGVNAPEVPGTGSAVAKLNQYLDDTLSWLKKFGSAKDVQRLKEIQQNIARNLYGKGDLAPTEKIAKQAALLTARGARKSLEEAAGASGPRLAALNKSYGDSVEIAEAAADAAARQGKGVGLGTAGLGLLGVGAAGFGQTKQGGELGVDSASLPLLLMAALSSPTGRMLAAGMLAKSSPAMKSLAPLISGSTSPFFLEKP